MAEGSLTSAVRRWTVKGGRILGENRLCRSKALGIRIHSPRFSLDSFESLLPKFGSTCWARACARLEHSRVAFLHYSARPKRCMGRRGWLSWQRASFGASGS